jgi:superfamily II DNA or RNA helicase
LPRIFDNINQVLLPALLNTLEQSFRADCCVGYFNLRGWRKLDSEIDKWAGGEGHNCRLLVGIQRAPEDEVRKSYSLLGKVADEIDNANAVRLKKTMAAEFREQLTIGYQSNDDEAGLRRLVTQLKSKKLIVKLYLRHPLHAKLYLGYRNGSEIPIVGYLGSSNLTSAGLSKQGELNNDVLDNLAAKQLADWFEDRWADRWCLDISDELVEIIEQSWARKELIPPYHIYLKMAYHLSQEARAGLAEFRIPSKFKDVLFDYQAAAVQIAARHLHKRGGVLIGDVVGLGKTVMATALARMFEDDFGFETLIISPKNLEPMWQDYRERYGLRGKVIKVSRAIQELDRMQRNFIRYRLILIDESHNLRNREGKTYKAIRDYVEKFDSHCILLTATPYNKTYLDLSSQLGLFVHEDKEIGIRPEKLLREIGELEFARLQCSPRSLKAFEKSEYADDWRDLMRLYLVRRTRSFIQENYAKVDCSSCGSIITAIEATCSKCGDPRPKTARRFLTFNDGSRSYFPVRKPKTVKYPIDPQYAALYDTDVVDVIDNLTLPRYGLANDRYGLIQRKNQGQLTTDQARIVQDLFNAGNRLKGFTKTNLFKRLESSGQAFILSVQRHIQRNYIYLHALENNLSIPIGTQDAAMVDAQYFDEDTDDTSVTQSAFDTGDETDTDESNDVVEAPKSAPTDAQFKAHAAEVYSVYSGRFQRRFKWLPSELFTKNLVKDLKADTLALLKVLDKCSHWEPELDEKLIALHSLLTSKHKGEKVLIFSQFADTVRYLETQLIAKGLTHVAGATGQSSNPTDLAWRFSPVSNDKRNDVSTSSELRVLVATDVLSEGQNLQDAHIVVNYDLPWAIIRLIQRAGRVDRIGQQAETILCYSFMQVDGVEKIISLRNRLRTRLTENAEVVGTDEEFFEGERNARMLIDIYNEKADILDGDAEGEIDLSSYAYQIWKNALAADPSVQKAVAELPAVSYSTREHIPKPDRPDGALVYVQTSEGTDALAWVNEQGRSITESQYAILKAAECEPDTPAVPRLVNHHDLVRSAVTHINQEEQLVGGQLGKPSGARFRTYERLSSYAQSLQGNLFGTTEEAAELGKAIEEIYRCPLTQTAIDRLNSNMRSGISDEMLAQLVVLLRNDNRLCVINEEQKSQEPRIICSMGLSSAH